MAQLAKENNMSIAYETSAGDVFPADELKYYKYADVPMCEFWQPFSDNYVGALNFKPIKPTASAAHLYGKLRVAAESFTSFSLTWDEHFSMLKEVNNVKAAEGVTHQVFHTYTHNPQKPLLPPGTSFGSGIGTPFCAGKPGGNTCRSSLITCRAAITCLNAGSRYLTYFGISAMKLIINPTRTLRFLPGLNTIIAIPTFC